MAWWVVYERCDDCQEASCLQCRRADRRLTLRVVNAEDRPEAALNGPCETPEVMLKRMGEYFGFDQETGIMYFRVDPK
jgi:hypothetical protein